MFGLLSFNGATIKHSVFHPFHHSSGHDQRESMRLLENQTMPSLRHVAHDGWLCAFTILQQLEIPSSCSWTALVRETGTVRKRQAERPVHHVQNHTCRPTLLQRARRAAVLGQPSNLRTHWPRPGHDCGALLVQRRENTPCCPSFGQQTATACTNRPKQILNKPTTRLYNSLQYKRYVSNIKYNCTCIYLTFLLA